MNLEQIDRRMFLRGLTLTSAGLVVPKPVMEVVPRLHRLQYDIRVCQPPDGYWSFQFYSLVNGELTLGELRLAP